MTWLQDQVAAAVKPSLESFDAGIAGAQANAAAAVGGIAKTAGSQRTQNVDLSKPYTSAGATAMNSYMDALGLPYLVSDAQAAKDPSDTGDLYKYYMNTYKGQTADSDKPVFRAQALAVVAASKYLNDVKAGVTKQGEWNDEAMRLLAKSNAGVSKATGGSLTEDQAYNQLYKKYQDNPTADFSPMMSKTSTSGNVTTITPSNSIIGFDMSASGPSAYGTYIPGSAASGPVYSTPSTPSQIMSKFANSPGYQTMLKAGLGNIGAQASSAGMLGSGAQIKALSKFNQDYAQRGYQQYLGNLMSAAGLGEKSTSNLVNANTSMTNANIGAQAQLGAANLNAQAQLAAQKAKTQSGFFTIGNNAYVGL